MEVIVKKLLMAVLVLIPVCLNGMAGALDLATQFAELYARVDQEFQQLTPQIGQALANRHVVDLDAIVDRPGVVNLRNVVRQASEKLRNILAIRCQEHEQTLGELRTLAMRLGVQLDDLPEHLAADLCRMRIDNRITTRMSNLQSRLDNMHDALGAIVDAVNLPVEFIPVIVPAADVSAAPVVDQGGIVRHEEPVVEHRAVAEPESKFKRIGKIAYAISCAMGAGFGLEYVLNNYRSSSTSGVRTGLSIQMPGVGISDDQSDIGLVVLKALSGWIV